MRLAIFFIFISIFSSVDAQELIFPKAPELRSKGVIYRTEKATEITVHTRGISLSLYRGELINYKTTKYKVLSFGYLRHPKEVRQSVQSNIMGAPVVIAGTFYVYGKQNSFLFINGGLGRKKLVTGKEKRRGIAVGYRVEGGGSLGLLKPYYLDLNKETIPGQSRLVSEKYSKENESVFLDNDSIFGQSGFFRGFGEMKFALGGYGKAGIHFSQGAHESFIRALEVGVMLNVYTKKLPILIIENNRFFFSNLYISVHFGKRS